MDPCQLTKATLEMVGESISGGNLRSMGSWWLGRRCGACSMGNYPTNPFTQWLLSLGLHILTSYLCSLILWLVNHHSLLGLSLSCLDVVNFLSAQIRLFIPTTRTSENWHGMEQLFVFANEDLWQWKLAHAGRRRSRATGITEEWYWF
jgi:hypothetical protein